MTRKIGQQLSERWGQPLIVENRGGAALTIGTAAAAKATPDGYTLLMSDRSAIAVAPSLYRDLPYRPLRDLAPITLVAVMSALLVAHPSVPAANLREFIEHAKRYPGTVNMAVGAPGTAGHIATALFKQMTGADVVMVPYKGGNQSILAVLSGEAKAALNSMPTSLPHVKTGKLKALASSGHTRFAGTPDIPTLAEAGVPGYHSEYGLECSHRPACQQRSSPESTATSSRSFRRLRFGRHCLRRAWIRRPCHRPTFPHSS